VLQGIRVDAVRQHPHQRHRARAQGGELEDVTELEALIEQVLAADEVGPLCSSGGIRGHVVDQRTAISGGGLHPSSQRVYHRKLEKPPPTGGRMSRLIATLSLVLVLLAVSGCKGDPTTPAYWEKSLSKAHKTQDKLRVVEDLRGSGHLNEGFLPLLHAQLAEARKPEVKAAVARTLAGLKNPASVGPLESAVDWGASGVAANQLNKEVASALGEIGDRKAVPVLVKLLKSRDNYTRMAAMDALGGCARRRPWSRSSSSPWMEAWSPSSTRRPLKRSGRLVTRAPCRRWCGC
jgi:hypothetical protein